MPDDTLGWLLTEFGRLAQPIRLAATSPGTAKDFFAALGWDLPENVQLQLRTAEMIQAVLQRVRPIAEATDDQRREVETMLGLYAELAQSIQALLAHLPTVLQDDFVLPPAYLTATGRGEPGIQEALVTRLLDLMFMRYVEVRACVAYSLLRLLGVFEIVHFDADPSIYRTAHNRRVIRWDRLSMLFTDGASLPADVYGWGTDHFNVTELLRRLGNVIVTLGGRVQSEDLSAADEARLIGPPAPGADPTPMPMVLASLYQQRTGTTDVDIGVALVGLRPTAAGLHDGGLGATPYAHGSLQLTLPLSDDLPLAIEIEAGADIMGGLAVLARPRSVEVKTALDGATAPLASGRLGFGLRYGNPTSENVRLLSLPGGSAIEVRELYLRGGGEASASGAIDGYIEAGVVGGRIVITMSEADGFLAELIPDGIEARADVMLGYSPRRGLYFQGSGSLEATIALNLELGPVSLDALHLVLGLAGSTGTASGLTLEASLDAGGQIGPVAASVERMGVKGTLAFRPGNLGPVDLGLAFQPPSGLGIAVDAGPISGGGFISYDPDNGRYVGVLSLEIYSISISAIGLLDTRLPGGAPGYSFLIIISARFTPIQIGMGFTLNGVGGLAGIHRRMVPEALQAGLRSGTIDHILFPEDPIHNAPAIISDLRTVFPPAQGRYVFGPMAIIGYTAFIELEVGLLLELPEPIRIALLGQLNAAFPSKDDALIDLHLDVYGILEFNQKLFSLEGILHHSKIAIFPVVGDMAMRLTWGDDPVFLMSVGGFNPQFRAPAGFPPLRRLSISFGQGGDLRIALSAYFALTSNTLQFGALAELYAATGSFSVHGWTGFDAFFQFTPFMLAAELSGGMELKNGDMVLGGVHVTAHLTGPGPWRAWGEAALTIAGVSAAVHIDATFGPPAPPLDAPRGNAWDLLRPALEDRRNWTLALPPSVAPVVTLVANKPHDGDPPVLLDPIGGATVRQKVVPLDKTLELFGVAPPLGADHFHIEEVRVAGEPASWTAVRDHFAPGQFERLTDAQKLSRPSFELMDAGLTFGVDALAAGPAVAVDLTYETRLIDATSSLPAAAFAIPLDHQLALMHTGAAARSPLRSSGQRKFAPPPGRASLVSLAEDTFIVASTDDLAPQPQVTGPTTKTAAGEALARHLAAHPGDRGKLQVI